MLAVLPGFGHSLSRHPIKLHQLTTRVELFYFVCRMKLVLRLDVGRWSRILRVWEIVKNRDLAPDDKVFGRELETIIQEINEAIAA